jgi:hypothetical protein
MVEKFEKKFLGTWWAGKQWLWQVISVVAGKQWLWQDSGGRGRRTEVLNTIDK